MNLRQKARARSLQGFEREGAGEVGRLREPLRPEQTEGSERCHELGAVHQGKPLLRAKAQWLEPGAVERFAPRQALAVEPGLALADQGQGQVSEGSKVAARTDGAPAGDVREHSAVQALQQQLDRLDARTRVALRESVRPE